MTLRRDFLGHSAESFVWRSTVLEALKKWNVRSKLFADPSQRGYVSLRWLSMIYHYNLVMLYRPTREVVEGMAGDWSVQACCQALLLFRKFQAAREIAQPWLGVRHPFPPKTNKSKSCPLALCSVLPLFHLSHAW